MERTFSVASIDVSQRPVNTFPGIFIVCNAALGVGTLNFPNAFARSGGLPFSIPILIMCATICGVALLVCAFGCYEAKSMEYFGAVNFYLGKWAVVLFHIGLTLSNIGTCILYMIIMGDQLDEVLYQFAGKDVFCGHWGWLLQRTFTMTVVNCVVVFPLCLVKSVDFLKWPSSIGVASMLYLTVVVVIDYFTNDHSDAIIETRPNSFADFFNAFPTILLGYQCMTNACPVFGCLKNKTVGNYVILVSGSMFLCTLVYLPIGTFGYLSNGKDVQGNVLKDYSASDPKILVAQIAVLFAVMMSYPVMYFISRPCIDELWVDSRKALNKDYDESKHATLRVYVIVIVFFLGTLGCALGLPDVTVAVNFTGSIASFFCAVLPGMFLIQTTYVPSGKRLNPSINEGPGDIPEPDLGASQLTDTEEHTKKREDHESSRRYRKVDPEKNENQESQSYFLTHKNAQGALTWTLRVVGSIFATVGFFLFGQGLVQAIQSVNDPSSPAHDKC